MAFGGEETITTAEVLEELRKRNGENKDLFYLYVSTSRIEVALGRKDQQQPLITKYFPIQDDYDYDTTDDDGDDDVTMSQPSASVLSSLSQLPIQDDDYYDTTDDDRDDGGTMSQPSASAQLSLSQLKKTVRKEVRRQIHIYHLSPLLYPEGWRKVVDKDGNPIHQTLYFNIIKKTKDESDVDHIQRVSKVREKIAKEMKKVRRYFSEKGYNVNFKTNSFLSIPLLCDSLEK